MTALARCAALLLLAIAATSHAAVVVTDDRGRTVTLPAPPARIVTLLPSLTETVCALQACDRLVGVDRFSDWPARVRHLPRLGGIEDPQLERIVALRPDLVLAARSAAVVDRLAALGIPALALEPDDFAGTRRTLGAVAAALGRPEAAAALWSRIEARIAGEAARVPRALRGQRVYFEIDASPYAAGTTSFVGELLARLGMGNVVPASLGPFPQLNPEFVVRAQPDIVMASAGDLAAMPHRPGWSALHALRARRQCGFAPGPYETIIRPGPRLGDAAALIADCLARLDASPQPSPRTRAAQPETP